MTIQKLQQNQPLDEIKTSAFDRRLSLAKTSFNIGKRWATSSAVNLFKSKEEKTLQKQAFIKEQSQYLVAELGKLKGSVVKIGQMLALYGEHFLPPEVTEALHTLNDNTATFSWNIIQSALIKELGDKIHEFAIEQTPIGTASLAQVHKAVHKSTGEPLVFKVQYPNIAEAVDSDLDLFRQLLKVTNIVPQTRQLDDWFEEIRDLLHHEVNYLLEAKTTELFYQRLQHDKRYVVPKVLPEYSTARVLCMSYESGISINSDQIANLPPHRKDRLAQASIELMLKEIFVWGDMQTDPNFGNYLIRLNDNGDDKLVLLDFGAIRQFDDKLLSVAKNLMLAGHQHDHEKMRQAITQAGDFYPFFANLNEKVKADMVELCLLASEPFSLPAQNPTIPNHVLDKDGYYLWEHSDLHNRVLKLAGLSATSKSFSVPPKELMFISRKFIGAYTFMTVFSAKTKADLLMKDFITTSF